MRTFARGPFRFCLRAMTGGEAYWAEEEGAGKWFGGSWGDGGCDVKRGALACCLGAGSQPAETLATRCCVPPTYVPQHLARVKRFQEFGRRCARFPSLNYCVHCGSRLEEAHRYCWNCGTARHQAKPAAGKPAPTQVAQTEPARRQLEAAGERPRLPDHVSLIAIVSAAAAVLFLVLLAQTLAMVLNPNGREVLNQLLVQAGVSPADLPTVLFIYEVSLLLFSLLPAIAHGLAYYGLVGVRRSGWVLAFILAIGWSLLLVGIPFAWLLWRRDTRDAFDIP